MIQDGKREDNIPITVDNLFWASVKPGPVPGQLPPLCAHYRLCGDKTVPGPRFTVYRITIMHTATDTAGRQACSQPQHILEAKIHFFKFQNTKVLLLISSYVPSLMCL